MHVALRITYVYDYTTKLYTKPAGVFQYYQNPNVRETGQGEAMERKYTVTEYGHMLGNAPVNTFPPEVTKPTVEPRLLSSQRFGKHIFVTTKHVHGFPWIRASLYKKPYRLFRAYPCGAGVEYLHRDPVCHRRRRKGKSQIWDSNIWPRAPRDSDPRKTVLARTINIYKRQACPLVREGAPRKQDRNCQTLINIGRGSTPRLTDWLTVSRNVTLILTSEHLSDRRRSRQSEIHS
jgi:hypothetical protein